MADKPFAHSADPESSLIRLLVEIEDMVAPAVCPNGRYAFFSTVKARISTNDYAISWYLLKLDGKAEPVRVWLGGDLRLQDGFPHVGIAAWSPDGTHVMFPVMSGDEAQLYVYNLTERATEKLGPVFGTIEEFVFLDRRRVAAAVGSRPPKFSKDAPYPQTGGISVPHGEHRNLVAGLGGLCGPIMEMASFPDRVVILELGKEHLSKHNPPKDAFARPSGEIGVLSAKAVSAVFEPNSSRQTEAFYDALPSLEEATIFDVATGGDAIAYLVVKDRCQNLIVARNGAKLHLGKFDLKTRAQVRWNRTKDSIFVTSNSPAGWEVRCFSLNGRDQKTLRGSGQILVAAGTDAEGRLLVVHSDSGNPFNLVAIDGKGTTHALTSFNQQFNSIRTSRPNVVETQDRYGRMVAGRFYKPKTAHACPVVVHIYGTEGFPRGGNGDEWPFLELLNRGIAVVDANPPCDDDITDDETADAQRQYVDGPVSGAVALIDALAQQGEVDPSRAGIVGLSFGTMVASWAGLKTRRFAAISTSGLDIYYTHQYFANGVLLPFLVEAIRKRDGDAIIEYFGMDIAPTLKTAILSHESEEEYMAYNSMFGLLKAFDRPIERYVFADERHVKTQPSNRYEIYMRNAQWFDFWLNGKEDPEPVDQDQYRRWHELRKQRDSN